MEEENKSNEGAGQEEWSSAAGPTIPVEPVTPVQPVSPVAPRDSLADRARGLGLRRLRRPRLRS